MILFLVLSLIFVGINGDYGSLANGASLVFDTTLTSSGTYVVVITSDSLSDDQIVSAKFGLDSAVTNNDLDSKSSALIFIDASFTGSEKLTITAGSGNVGIGDVQLYHINSKTAITITPEVATTTQTPTTKAPTTKSPTTKSPTTKSPTTSAPTTKSPTTSAPTTKSPITSTAAPTTSTTAGSTTAATVPVTFPATVGAGNSISFFATLPSDGLYYTYIYFHSTAGDNQLIHITMGGDSADLTISGGGRAYAFLSNQVAGPATLTITADSNSFRVVIRRVTLNRYEGYLSITFTGSAIGDGSGIPATPSPTMPTPLPTIRVTPSPATIPSPLPTRSPVSNSQEQFTTYAGIQIDNKMQRYLLDRHNELRNKVALNGLANQPKGTYMNQLHFDPALAAVAQRFTNTCPSGHNNERVSWFTGTYGASIPATFKYDADGVSIGENYLKYSLNSASTKYEQAAGFIEDGWWNEYTDYTYNTGSCSGVCGHYTQMAWANSRYLGCGATECDSGNGYTQLVVVCNYYPAGNFNGEKPYTSGTPCSGCKENARDRDECDGSSSGLCGGCQSEYFGMCDNKYSNCESSLYQYCPSSAECQANPKTADVCEWCPKSCGTCTESQLQPPSSCDDNADNLDYTAASAFIGIDGDEESVKTAAGWAVTALCIVFGLCVCLLIIGWLCHRRKVDGLQKQIRLISPRQTEMGHDMKKTVKLADDDEINDDEIEVSYNKNMTQTAD